jgi:lysophospholipase L1-like esterase
LFTASCDEGQDSFVDDVLDPEMSKYVAIGDSLTAGVQSDGIVRDFQQNSFPALIAKQMGINNFEQPIVNSPGIGFEPGKTPLMYMNGEIFRNDLDVDEFDLLSNFFLTRPYDNLGLPGAEIVDVASTTMLLFEVVLRGLGTQLEQAISLDPALITLWIGGNDVLGSAKAGGDFSKISSAEDFESEYRNILMQLTNRTQAMIVTANLPNVADISFVISLDRVFRVITDSGTMSPVPVVFDDNFNPVDFGDGLFIPLLTEEGDVGHLTLSALDSYRTGAGIPDETALMDMGFSMEEAANITATLQSLGLVSNGDSLKGDLTLTIEESAVIQGAVQDFNSIISNVAGEFGVPVVDINEALMRLNNEGIDGYTSDFVLIDPVNTAYSLDGIHPNDGGYAIIANLFIETINESLDMAIPLVNTEQFRGQYSN